jgi:hypothetical protein
VGAKSAADSADAVAGSAFNSALDDLIASATAARVTPPPAATPPATAPTAP